MTTLEQDLRDGLETWVAALSPHTKKAYVRGLDHFAQYLVDQGLLERPTPVAGDDRAPVRLGQLVQHQDLVAGAGRYLLSQPPGRANAIVQAYLQHLCAIEPETGLPAYTRQTAQQRLSALRWAVREARRRGLVTWSLDVVVPKLAKGEDGRLCVRPGRDMRGPTTAQLRSMLDLAAFRGRGAAGDGCRWLLVLSLIAHETLRAHEICALDLADVDEDERILVLVRKKEQQQSQIPLSERTFVALRRWVRRRGQMPGPLVWGGGLEDGHARVVKGARLTPNGVDFIVRTLGERTGVQTSPHKVRHTAITLGQAARERLQIPIQDAMQRAGHRSLQAHQRYLDADLDNVRRLSDAVAEQIGAHG